MTTFKWDSSQSFMINAFSGSPKYIKPNGQLAEIVSVGEHSGKGVDFSGTETVTITPPSSQTVTITNCEVTWGETVTLSVASTEGTCQYFDGTSWRTLSGSTSISAKGIRGDITFTSVDSQSALCEFLEGGSQPE